MLPNKGAWEASWQPAPSLILAPTRRKRQKDTTRAPTTANPRVLSHCVHCTIDCIACTSLQMAAQLPANNWPRDCSLNAGAHGMMAHPCQQLVRGNKRYCPMLHGCSGQASARRGLQPRSSMQTRPRRWRCPTSLTLSIPSSAGRGR